MLAVLVTILAVAIHPAQARETAASRTLLAASCTFKGQDYANGTLASDEGGFCTCSDGVLTGCGCYNFDKSTASAGGYVFKSTTACRCTAVASNDMLVNSTSDCVELRSNVLSAAFRAPTMGSDWGFNFDPAVTKVLNGGNFLPALESGATSVYSVVPACSSAPHWHPRASETYIVPSGTITTLFSEETASKLYRQDIVGPGLSVMPRGLLHTLVNPTCETINIFVTYNSNDQGRVNVPGIDCASPPTATDGPSLLIAEHCKLVAECKSKCGLP